MNSIITTIKNKPHQILLFFIFLLVIAIGIMSLSTPPGADPDPCWGFLVMHYMEQGHLFNLLLSPDASNLAKNHSLFLAWWSPGQYLLPYLFKLQLKINTGQATALTISCCSLFGLAGYYKLFKQLGFTAWVSAGSIAFIACQLFFINPFVYYPGGEVLLFAFMGWFLFGCFSFNKVTWQVYLFVFLGLLAGFFCKSSVLWMFAAGIACMWVNISDYETTSDYPLQSKTKLRVWLKNGVILAIPSFIAFVVIYVLYLSKGPNPSQAGGGLLFKPETFSFPLASPILSGFSVDELFNGLIYHTDDPVVSHPQAVFILFILALGSLVYVFLILKYPPDKKYITALLIFYLVGTLFFSYMFLKQATITYEARHLRIIGLLAIPGLVYLCSKNKISRSVFGIVWLLFIAWGIHFLIDGFQSNRQAARGSSGLSQPDIDQTALDTITKIDHNQRYAIFVLMNPNMGVEINNNRVITIAADNMAKKDFLKLKYAGKGGTLYILMPSAFIPGYKKTAIINSFKSYHHFNAEQLSPDFWLYTAKN